MSVLFSIFDLRHAFSNRNLFEGLTFSVYEGEKIALIGPNGAGKSTLLKIMAGEMLPDSGKVSRTKGIRVGYLTQAPVFDDHTTVREAIFKGIDELGDWSAVGAAEEAMSRLGIKSKTFSYEDRLVNELSGGWQKKVALAHELAKDPDIILLDEPTNHLDVESVLWLEEWVRTTDKCVVAISHDRYFLQRIAKRVIEVDKRNPNGILSIEGSYQSFLTVKEEYLENQLARESSLKNVLRQEVEWLKRGAKARTTKQKARIDRAGDLMDTVADLKWRNQKEDLKLDFGEAGSAPKKLVTLEHVTKGYSGRVLFSDLNLLITPKTRLGLIGANGIGKSTLVRLIAGIEKPDSGTVELSDRLQVNYFEQTRETLDPDLTVLRTVCPYGETVEFQNKKMHVRGYLDRFLFSGPKVDQPVSSLSGGEQARLLLAKIMLSPCNLLILDEPTNDLDLQTLGVLEDTLKEFPGAVILVSHDRAFMGEVCDHILAFPQMLRFADIDQWETWFKAFLKNGGEEPKPKGKNATISQSVVAASPAQIPQAKKKLSYKEQVEFDGMENSISDLEEAIAHLDQQSQRPDVVSNSVELLKVSTEMSNLQLKLEKTYERWAELEGKGGVKK
jgi:ATP-binding cassette subfamily F protein uup